jgi:uncharacterized protein (DUF302 family)
MDRRFDVTRRIHLMSQTSDITANANGVISVTSSYPFADTVQRLISTLTSHGLKIFATIDQRAEAESAGLALYPATLIVFGNPKAGTPLMIARPLSGIDLPLKVLVAEAAPGVVQAHFNSAAYILERHALPAECLQRLAPAEQLIAHALAP